MLTRRKMLAWLGAAGGMATGIAAETPCGRGLAIMRRHFATESAETRWAKSARRKREMTRDVVWLTHEPIEFLLRRGDHSDNEAEHYQRMLDPENIKRMAAAGVTYGRIFFYKGFGLEFERPHMEQARQAARLMHELGMKVSLYMGGTMFVETFFRETPAAANWNQRDQWNQPVTYGQQTYRHYACPNEPAYRDYLRRVLKIAVQELRADEIAFDNIMLQSEPHSCHCPRCLAAFSVFLKRRYPNSEAAVRRFGYPDTNWIQAPHWESEAQPQSFTVLDDPVLQEWVRFRCETLANYSADLYNSVKRLNPNTAVLFNIKGVYSFNRYWTNAVYHPLFANHVDLMAFDTGGYDEHIDKRTGALISQIRSYKVARRFNSGCEDAFANDVRAAVHMAFGHQKPICVPAPMGSGAFNTFTPLLEFFREHNNRYYTETNNIADVAIVRDWASMAYSISDAYVPATLMEQVLIQYKVPFDLLFDEQFDLLGKYKAVIFAGQECLSEVQEETLLRYVRGGGVLLLTTDTAKYNAWREKRRRTNLLPARSEGKGQIVLLPNIEADEAAAGRRSEGDFVDPEPGATAHRGAQMAPPQWILPKNHKVLYDTVAGNVPSGLCVQTDAPLTTVMEVLQRSSTQETILHFVNFKQDAVAPFTVRLSPATFSGVKSAMLFLPEQDESIRLEVTRKDGGTSVSVPKMKTYGMLVFSHG
jgi:hypothetical protein